MHSMYFVVISYEDIFCFTLTHAITLLFAVLHIRTKNPHYRKGSYMLKHGADHLFNTFHLVYYNTLSASFPNDLWFAMGGIIICLAICSCDKLCPNESSPLSFTTHLKKLLRIYWSFWSRGNTTPLLDANIITHGYPIKLVGTISNFLSNLYDSKPVDLFVAELSHVIDPTLTECLLNTEFSLGSFFDGCFPIFSECWHHYRRYFHIRLNIESRSLYGSFHAIFEAILE